jgi:hypothetical protein
MTTKLYPKYKESCLSQNPSVDMDTDTIKAALVDTGTYTYSDAHQYYSSVSGVVGTPQTLGSKTVTNGVFDAADVTFTAVTGNSAEAIVIYKDTGTEATRMRVYLCAVLLSCLIVSLADSRSQNLSHNTLLDRVGI